MTKYLNKIRQLKNTLKLILSYILCFIIMNLFDARNPVIFSVDEGGIYGLTFMDGDTLILGFVILFIYWLFWGFGKDSTS